MSRTFLALTTKISVVLSIQPKIPVISVGTSNGTDHFGLVRPEYSGPALKVVHFDQSGYFGRSDRIVVHSTTLLYPACKNNNQARGGLGRVCATGMYRSIEHVKFPKFQTGIFVEWKAPLVSLVLRIFFVCIFKLALTATSPQQLPLYKGHFFGSGGEFIH